MTNLKILLGWVPKTAEYEAKQSALRKEYNDLTSFAQSKELAEYLELEKTVTSPEFAAKKKAILTSRYKDTPEYAKEREYLSLKNRKEIRKYYLVKDSVALKDFIEFDQSFDVKHYHTLDAFLRTEEFKAKRKQKRRIFRESEEYKKLVEFHGLKKSSRFRGYFSFKASRDYINFTLLIGSEKIQAFEELARYITTESFKKTKEHMMLPGRKKFEMSEGFLQEKKYAETKKSEKFQWYFKVRNSNRFEEIKKWKLSFADEFEETKLDKAKWLPRYFWGEVVLKDSYAKEGEKQFYPDDQNIEISNSILKISTRRQKFSGKTWNPAIGFYPHEFNYTSGIINTGARFRQQYGRFEAKIRFNRNYPVNHAFWMISDLMLPHIDIARAGKKITVGTFWGNPNAKNGIDKVSTSMSRSRFGYDYHIFSLEWTQEKLVWKVNGVTICTSIRGVPQVPMYVNINSALYSEPNGTALPAELDVDWVRCYRQT